MLLLLLYLQILTIQGQDRVVLRGSNSPCKGRLEVYRTQDKEKKWGLVCPYGWNDRNGKVVCKSLGCGDLKKTDKEMSLYTDSSLDFFMDQVNCSSKEENLKSCPHRGPPIDCKGNGFVAVECSGNVELSLTDKCAGVVQFTTQKGVIGVCGSSQWDKVKADRICKELNCGQHSYIPKPGMFDVKPNTQKGALNCVRDEKFSWQCMELPQSCSEDASVICTKYRRFRLKGGSNHCSGSIEELKENKWVQQTPKNINLDTICAQMNCGSRKNITDVMKTNGTHLTCSGNVNISKLPECFGSVNVNVNGAAHGVCFNDFHFDELGKVICRELGCGEVKEVKKGEQITNGWLFECQGDEESLWHCLAIHKKTKCYSTKVICSDSLKVRLSDGWSPCSGRVQVNVEGSWKYVNAKDLTDKNSNVVCKDLKCGNSFKMTQDQNLFIEVNPQVMVDDWEVNCPSSSKKFHECLKKITKEQKQIKFVTKQIICQNEEFKFIKGDQPCQGEIGIERFNGTEGSFDPNTLNNATVCSEMNCGDLQLSGTSTTHVNCSGSVNVSLSMGCWGEVKVEIMVVQNKCRNDGCGGICKKTWRTEESKMLCKDLGCGNPIEKFKLPEKLNHLPVKHYSVYCPKQVNNLKMCKFTPNKDICKDPASVLCSGSVKSGLFSPLEIPRDKCAGNVKLFYTGEWRPVCKDSLNQNLQNIICKELSCGEAKSVETARFEEGQTKGLIGIKCSNDAKSLLKCEYEDVSIKDCIAGYLKCSGWTRLLLYKNDGPCSGPVYAVSEHRIPQHVNIQNWTKHNGQLMCEYLQCGNYKSHTLQTTASPTTEWWNKTYNCIGNETKNIWDCERDNQSVQHKQLNITCDAETLDLKLSKSCKGEVRINNEPVCASQWTKKMSDDVCDKLQCGRAIHYWQEPISTESQGWHFSCSGSETFLQQCSHKRGKCANTIFVDCHEGVKFGTTKKCGGFLGVKYQDQWKYVCGDLKKPEVDKVCKVLDCQKNQAPLIEGENTASKKKHVTIRCPDKNQDLSQCINHILEDNCKPFEIKCEGFEEPSLVNIGLVVGLLLGFLGLLVLIVITQRKRLLSALRRYRSKDVKNMNFIGHEMNNTETVDEDSTERKFDQDDYQDVDIAITNTEREHDVDDKSARSSGTEYDDIEEQANDASYPQTPADEDQTLPLLPSRPENLHDEVTYEVEKEIQEDYDDVMSEEALANENAEISMKDAPAQADVIMDEGGNANTNEVEVEVHSQPE